LAVIADIREPKAYAGTVVIIYGGTGAAASENCATEIWKLTSALSDFPFPAREKPANSLGFSLMAFGPAIALPIEGKRGETNGCWATEMSRIQK
jgi:hypothetical protein